MVCPEGMELTVIEHDFLVGGKWKYSMPTPNGAEFISAGEFSEFVEQ